MPKQAKPKVLSPKQSKLIKKRPRGRQPHPTSLAVCKLKPGQSLLLPIPKGRKPLSYANTLSGLLRNKPSWAYKHGVRVSILQAEDGKGIIVTRRK